VRQFSSIWIRSAFLNLLLCACFHFFLNCSACPWFVFDLLTSSWNVQHCRGLSNLLRHGTLDDLPDTWEMRHRNRVAFVPWPCKVTLTCCSETPTGGVKEHSHTEFLVVCRVDDDQAILSEEADLDHGSELWANEARVVSWSWYASTSVLTRWFSSLRSGWIGDGRVVIAVTQGCCYRIRCCNRRGCVWSWVSILAWENGESNTYDADVLSYDGRDSWTAVWDISQTSLVDILWRCFWTFVSDTNRRFVDESLGIFMGDAIWTTWWRCIRTIWIWYEGPFCKRCIRVFRERSDFLICVRCILGLLSWVSRPQGVEVFILIGDTKWYLCLE